MVYLTYLLKCCGNKRKKRNKGVTREALEVSLKKIKTQDLILSKSHFFYETNLSFILQTEKIIEFTPRYE